jgi:hypothetical protein
MASEPRDLRPFEQTSAPTIAASDLDDVTIVGLTVPRAKNVRSGLFGFCLLVFILFPLLSVRCQSGQMVGSTTGMELVTGKTVQSQSGSTFMPPEPLAVLTLGAIVVGIGAHAIKATFQWIVTGVAGAIGAVALLLLKSKMEGLVATQSQGLARLDPEAGYWLSLVLLLAGAGLSFLAYRQLKDL